MSEELGKLLKEFNRRAAPDAEASLESFSEGAATIVVRGSFYTSCGLYSWVDELVEIARELGLNLEIRSVEEKPDALVLELALEKSE